MEATYHYKEKFIAFIDMLGFKNLINTHGDEIIDQIVDTIEKSLVEYKKRFDFDSSAPNIDMIGYKILNIYPKYYLLSDSIILTIEDAENNLIRFLTGIMAVQKEFIKSNIFVRGAIVKGEIFELEGSNNNMVFGPGGIDAIQMEANHSIYPRIIVSESVLDSLKQKHLEAQKKNLAILKDLFRFYTLKDNNGVCFIDYLSTFFLKLTYNNRLKIGSICH